MGETHSHAQLKIRGCVPPRCPGHGPQCPRGGKGAGGVALLRHRRRGGLCRGPWGEGLPRAPPRPSPRPLTRGDPLSGLALHCLLQEAPGPAAGCGPCSLRRWPEAEGGLRPHAWASLSFSPAVSQGKRAPEREFVAGPLAGPSALRSHMAGPCRPGARPALTQTLLALWTLAAPSPVSTEQQLSWRGAGRTAGPPPGASAAAPPRPLPPRRPQASSSVSRPFSTPGSRPSPSPVRVVVAMALAPH